MTDPSRGTGRQNADLSGRRVMDDSLGICRISAAEDINLTAAAYSRYRRRF